MEGMATDLFGFVPHQQHSDSWLVNNNDYLTFFCGNFGILLLNPSWLSIDGGRTALDVLEKMVSVVSSLSLSLFACDCWHHKWCGVCKLIKREAH